MILICDLFVIKNTDFFILIYIFNLQYTLVSDINIRFFYVKSKSRKIQVFLTLWFLFIAVMVISIFPRSTLYQTSIWDLNLAQILYRFDPGKTVKWPIKNVRYGPEKLFWAALSLIVRTLLHMPHITTTTTTSVRWANSHNKCIRSSWNIASYLGPLIRVAQQGYQHI